MDAKSPESPQKALKTGQKRDKFLQKVAFSRMFPRPPPTRAVKNRPDATARAGGVPKTLQNIP